jgi:hypothetical protein
MSAPMLIGFAGGSHLAVTTFTFSLTTSGTNNTVLVGVVNSNNPTNGNYTQVTGITCASPALVLTRMASVFETGIAQGGSENGGSFLEVWTVYTPLKLTSAVFTVTLAAKCGNLAFVAFSDASAANPAAPFDPAPILPAVGQSLSKTITINFGTALPKAAVYLFAAGFAISGNGGAPPNPWAVPYGDIETSAPSNQPELDLTLCFLDPTPALPTQPVSYSSTLNGLLGIVVAVTPSVPATTVQITAHGAADLEYVEAESVAIPFDAGDADLLVLSAAHASDSYWGPLEYSFGGQPIAMAPALSIASGRSIAMEIGFLARPPAGSQLLVAQGLTGYTSETTLCMVGLKALSGVMGIRVAAQHSGTMANFALPASTLGSLLLAFIATMSPAQYATANTPWVRLDGVTTNPLIQAWIFDAVGLPAQNLIVTPSGGAGTVAGIVIEALVAQTATPNHVAAGAAQQLVGVATGAGRDLGVLAAGGQDLHVWWDTALDVPNKSAAMLQPDDFYLARIPAQVSTVILLAGVPRCTYVGLSSSLIETTGLLFPGSATLLRATLALLRQRNPTVKVVVAMQQGTIAEGNNDPYDAEGWAGMTTANVAAMAQFVRDMALDGVMLDYRCQEMTLSGTLQCTLDGTGAVHCYTDAELLATIKALRAGLPRPLLLYLAGLHEGAYATGGFLNAPPIGMYCGYDVCVANDATALGCLDGIHAMTFDAGPDFDPRTALAAFAALFPGLPIRLGLRVGPAEDGGVRRTAAEMRDFCNTVIRYGGAGVHLFTGMWDVAYLGRYDGGATEAPFSDYDQEFPDANIAGAVAASVFNLGRAVLPPGVGYAGTANQMRIDNNHLLAGRLGAPAP